MQPWASLVGRAAQERVRASILRPVGCQSADNSGRRHQRNPTTRLQIESPEVWDQQTGSVETPARICLALYCIEQVGDIIPIRNVWPVLRDRRKRDLPLARFSGVDDANSSVVSYPACDRAKKVDLGSARVEIDLDDIWRNRAHYPFAAGRKCDRSEGEVGCGIKIRIVGSTWFLILCPLPSVGYVAGSSHDFPPLSPSLASPSLANSVSSFTMNREAPTVPQSNPVFRFNRETYSIKIENLAEQGTCPSNISCIHCCHMAGV